MSSPANVPVKVGVASSPRNVEEEEQILEAQSVPVLLAPSGESDQPLTTPSQCLYPSSELTSGSRATASPERTSVQLVHTQRKNPRQVRFPAQRARRTETVPANESLDQHGVSNRKAEFRRGEETAEREAGAPDTRTRSASARAPNRSAARAIDSAGAEPPRPRRA